MGAVFCKLMTMNPHVFDQAIALTATGDGQYTGATSPAFANMVGPFGGVTAATALNAVLLHPQLQGEPVALTVNFCAPIADGAFTATARPVRTNRSTQHWVVELTQAGATVMTATAMTAARRETWSVDDQPMPVVPLPDAVPDPTQAPRVDWVRRYQMRFIEGGVPSTWDGGGGHSQSLLWMREAAPRRLDFTNLTALADLFFPRVWLRRATLVPAGTVSMTVYFHAGAAPLAELGHGWVLGQARAQAFRNGFFDQTAQLWSEGGHLLATSHQVVYYKE